MHRDPVLSWIAHDDGWEEQPENATIDWTLRDCHEIDRAVLSDVRRYTACHAYTRYYPYVTS